MKEALSNILHIEKTTFILWVPVFIAIGILAYFFFDSEPYHPSTWMYCIGIIIWLTSCAIVPRLATSLVLIVLGFAIAQYHGNHLDNYFISESKFYKNIVGKIRTITHKEKFIQLVIDDIQSTHHEKIKKIKLSVRTKTYANIEAGDVVYFSAKLSPPPLLVTKNAYDFAKLAYFAGINATGFATSEIALLKKPTKRLFTEYLLSIREVMYKKFMQNMSVTEANVAAAMIIGKKEGINNKVTEAFRNTGTSHLLAISGLHLTLVRLIFYCILRYILLTSEYISLKYEVKKIAALFAMAMSYCYLIIAGASISAERAFIMSFLVFLAIVLDRKSNLIRITMFAAIIILCMDPVAIFNPSFQMSFSAVIALATMLSKYKTPTLTRSSMALNKVYQIFYYVKSTMLSSLVASLATLPYTIYTFNYFSVSGLVANIFAIPITTTLIMPLGIVSSALSFSAVSKPFYLLMEYSIKSMIFLIEKTALLPYSHFAVKSIAPESVIYITLGMLMFALLKTKVKYLGCAMIALGILKGFFYTSPDLIIHENLVAIKWKDNRLYFLSSTKVRSNFIVQTLLRQNAQKDTLLANHNIVKELQHRAFFLQERQSVIFNYLPYNNNYELNDYLLVCLNEKNHGLECDITYHNIKNKGTHLVWFDPYRIEYSKNNRKWHTYVNKIANKV